MKVDIRDVIRTGPPSTDQRALFFELDGRTYRAIRAPAADLFQRLLAADWLPDLLDAGLVPLRAADITIDGYPLVVETERVAIVSYPPEWPTDMLRAAGATIAQLGLALARRGLGLTDAHPWNVLFDGATPKFIDLGSITESTAVSPEWVAEFRRHIVLPLALHRVGWHSLGDSIQRTPRGGWTDRLDRRGARWFPPRYTRLGRRRREPTKFYEGLVGYLSDIGAGAAPTAWSQYYEVDEPEVGRRDLYNDKQRSVDEALSSIPDGTVLDVGSNAGWYSELAALRGHRVVSMDPDDRTLNLLFQRARRLDLAILPLRMDLMWPSGSFGLGLEYRAAPDRLRSDVVMVLAVLHHLVGFQGITFDAFARVVDMFARSIAIVEFVPGTDKHVADWPLAGEPWYNVDALIGAMDPYFQILQRLPSTPSPREILVFNRR